MTQTEDENAKKIIDLRRQAKERLTQDVPSVGNLSLAERDRLLHELNVQQIELELQNEALRESG